MEANTENKTVSIFFPVVGAHFSKGDENTTSKPDSTLQSFGVFRFERNGKTNDSSVLII